MTVFGVRAKYYKILTPVLNGDSFLEVNKTAGGVKWLIIVF